MVKLIRPLLFEDQREEERYENLILPIIFENKDEKPLIKPIFFDVDSNAEYQQETIKESIDVCSMVVPFNGATISSNFNETFKSVIGIADEKESAKSKPYDVAQYLAACEYFCNIENALYHFNGIVYQIMDEMKLSRLIIDRCRKDVSKNGNPRFVKDIARFLMIEPKLCAKPKENTQYLAFRNGVLDLNSGAFYPPTPNIFLTSFLNLDYDPLVKEFCPEMDTFICTVSGGEQILIDRIWECLGYFITQDMNAKRFLLLQGVGDSGKSKFGQFLTSLFDESACASVDAFRLGDRFSLYGLVGKRINISMDLPEGKLNDRAVAMIKQLTGGDALTAEGKFENSFTFRNTCKLVFASNHPLKINGKDQAFWNRVLLIPFLYAIPKEQQNPQLLDAFECEKLSIVKKALRYYCALVKRQYRFSGDDIYLVAGCRYMESEENILQRFIDDCCEFGAEDFHEFTFALHEAYREFCQLNGYVAISDMVKFSSLFYQCCGERVKRSKRRGSGISINPQNGYSGVRLCVPRSACQEKF